MSGFAVRLATLAVLFGVAMATIDIGMGVKYAAPNCTDPNQIYYPHTLCHKFYQCENGVARLRFCRPLNLFHRDLLQCRPFREVDCEKPVTTVASTETTATTATATSTAATTVRFFALRPRAPPMVCPASGTYMLPHEDCSSYYTCQDGQVSVHKCKNFQRFDPVKRECAASWSVNCEAEMEPVYDNSL